MDMLEGLSSINFDIVLKYSVFLLVGFWLVVVVWVWFDSSERTESYIARFLAALLVLVANIPGLIIYLILRPRLTVQEQYWSELERRYLMYETAELGDCDKCGNMMQPGFVYCPFCKEEVKVKCGSCGVNIDKRWVNCAYCGEENKSLKRNGKEIENGVVGEKVVLEPEDGNSVAPTIVRKKIRYETFSEFMKRKIAQFREKREEKMMLMEAKRKEKETQKAERKAKEEAESKVEEVSNVQVNKDSKKKKKVNKNKKG